MKKFVQAAAATVAFVVALLGIYAAHVRWFEVDVVFYAALQDAVLGVALCGALLFLLRRRLALTGFERLQLVVIWILGGYAFAISFPTVIDRSLSFYILEKLEQRGGGIRLDAFERVFTEEYVREHRLVDVRLTEQLESGTIAITDGCVTLTDRGRSMSRFSRFFRAHLLPRQRLLMGRYSDDLTDPFRETIETADYRCR
jgi:hypothetical protein